MRSKRGAARLHPFWSHSGIAFTCAPRADRVLAPGAQSVAQAGTQQLAHTQQTSASMQNAFLLQRRWEDSMALP